MATKEEIKEAIYKKGLSQGSWARVRGFNANNVRNCIARHANKEKNEIRSIKYSEINEAFKQDFGIYITKENNHAHN